MLMETAAHAAGDMMTARRNDSIGIGREAALQASSLLAVLFLVTVTLAGAGSLLQAIEKEPFAVAGFSPGDGEENVDVYGPISLEFTRPVDAGTLKNVVISPPVVGVWETEGRSAVFLPQERMDSHTSYTVTVTGAVRSEEGKSLRTRAEFTFTTGNGSARIVENGTSVQVDYIGWVREDGEWRVFATSLADVVSDDEHYPKSVFYLRVYKEEFSKLRRFPIIVGKEEEFKVFEERIMGLHIGDNVDFTLEPGIPFGEENTSLIHTIPLKEILPREENVTLDEAYWMFAGNLTLGAPGLHPFWGWNVTLVQAVETEDGGCDTGADGGEAEETEETGGCGSQERCGWAIIRHDPPAGAVVHPYGWDTLVSSINSTSVSVVHNLSEEDLYEVYSFQGSFPDRIFMVTELNLTAGYVVIDENWPPGIRGKETRWWLGIYDIRYPWEQPVEEEGGCCG